MNSDQESFRKQWLIPIVVLTLASLLVFIDEEPELARLCVVDALGGGARVLEERAHVLEQLRKVLWPVAANASSCSFAILKMKSPRVRCSVPLRTR